MKKMLYLQTFAASVMMLVLMLDGGTAAAGISEGIRICIQTLIPSLFPFFVLSGILAGCVSGQRLRLLEKLCRLPEGSGFLLITGLLCGYPVGAANITQAHRQGSITLSDAQRMAVFCNNAGPAFLFGILGPIFPDIRWVILLWMIQILAAILTAILTGTCGSDKFVPSKPAAVSVSSAMNTAVKSMATVCGWVVFFRMILSFLEKWILHRLGPALTVLLTGLLELSNGCLLLRKIQNPAVGFLLASFLLSVGGLCILMQTKGVFPLLDLRKYLGGKLFQCILAMDLSLPAIACLMGFRRLLFFSLLGNFLIFPVLFSGKRKKEVAIT